MGPAPRVLALTALLIAGPAHADDAPIGPGEGVQEEDAPDAARVWVYVDSGGQLHFVDRLELVPAQYRSRARETSLVTTQSDRDEAASLAARKRRDARVQAAADARKREAAARLKAKEEASRRAQQDAEAAAPGPAEQLAEALTERRAVLEEIVTIEDGFSEDESASAADLEARIEALDKRLEELDRRIRALERAR
jgi:hypothetical protein